jgi:hypothetical protein
LSKATRVGMQLWLADSQCRNNNNDGQKQIPNPN